MKVKVNNTLNEFRTKVNDNFEPINHYSVGDVIGIRKFSEMRLVGMHADVVDSIHYLVITETKVNPKYPTEQKYIGYIFSSNKDKANLYAYSNPDSWKKPEFQYNIYVDSINSTLDFSKNIDTPTRTLTSKGGYLCMENIVIGEQYYVFSGKGETSYNKKKEREEASFLGTVKSEFMDFIKSIENMIYSNKDTRGMCWIKDKGFNAIEEDLPGVEGTNLDAWVKYKWEKMRRLNLINK